MTEFKKSYANFRFLLSLIGLFLLTYFFFGYYTTSVYLVSHLQGDVGLELPTLFKLTYILFILAPWFCGWLLRRRQSERRWIGILGTFLMLWPFLVGGIFFHNYWMTDADLLLPTPFLVIKRLWTEEAVLPWLEVMLLQENIYVPAEERVRWVAEVLTMVKGKSAIELELLAKVKAEVFRQGEIASSGPSSSSSESWWHFIQAHPEATVAVALAAVALVGGFYLFWTALGAQEEAVAELKAQVLRLSRRLPQAAAAAAEVAGVGVDLDPDRLQEIETELGDLRRRLGALGRRQIVVDKDLADLNTSLSTLLTGLDEIARGNRNRGASV